jgi:hypothetical protein
MSKLIYITNTSLDGYVEDEPVPSIGSIPIRLTRSSLLLQPDGREL